LRYGFTVLRAAQTDQRPCHHMQGRWFEPVGYARPNQWVMGVRLSLSMSAVDTPVFVGCRVFQAFAW